jgi:hypothetical protein
MVTSSPTGQQENTGSWSCNSGMAMTQLPITVAALNIEPLGSIFVGEKSKEVSMVFESFPQKKESQVVQ